MRFAAALLIAILVGLPVGGLMMGLISPPHHPFETASISLSNTIILFFRTFSLGVLVSLLSLAIGAWFAWVEQRGLYRGVKLLGVMSLLPLAIPSYLLAGTLRDTLGVGGWIGKPLGLPMFTGIIPAVIIALVFGGSGLSRLLIFSQIVLSLQLPFAVMPLIYFTGSKKHMGEFANRMWLKLVVLAIATIIVGLNSWLVMYTFFGV